MNDLARRMVKVGALFVLQGCSGEKTKSAPTVAPTTVTSTALPCFIAKGTRLSDADDLPATPMNLSGPTWCGRVLELFLLENPTRHILHVLPINYPLEKVRVRGEAPGSGTQELLVVHADGGAGPVASSLEVRAVPCFDVASSTSSHALCQKMIDDVSRFADDIEFWVPLTSIGTDATSTAPVEPFTSELLQLRRRTVPLRK
jgi:hypothetical protein